MRVVRASLLKDFWKLYPDSEKNLRSWHDEVKRAVWRTPADIKKQYRNASILKKSRVVFNVCGNKYRLLVEVIYPIGVIHIIFLDTHKRYAKIDAEEYKDEPIQSYKKRKRLS